MIKWNESPELLAEVEAIKAEQRAKRAAYRHAYDNATRTLSDVQFDANVECEEQGGPSPW